MSLDAVISADLVRVQAEISALGAAMAATRIEIAAVNTQLAGSSAIRSIQRGIITFVSNGPIEVVVNVVPVNPSKSALHYLGSQGWLYISEGGYYSNDAIIQLQGNSQIKAITYGTSSPWAPAKVSWELVEYK